jgi:hypothetical protein
VMVAMMMKPSSNQCAVLRNHFVHLSQWERSCMLTTSPEETKLTLLILKGLKRKDATKQMRINDFFKKK